MPEMNEARQIVVETLRKDPRISSVDIVDADTLGVQIDDERLFVSMEDV